MIACCCATAAMSPPRHPAGRPHARRSGTGRACLNSRRFCACARARRRRPVRSNRTAAPPGRQCARRRRAPQLPGHPTPEIPMRTPTTPTVLLPLALAALGLPRRVRGRAHRGLAPRRAPGLARRRRGGRAPLEGAVRRRDRRSPSSAARGPTKFHQTGTCQLAHLGRTTVVTEETGVPESATWRTSTFTAANGDRLYTTGISARVRDRAGRQPHDHRHLHGGGRHGAVRGRERHRGVRRDGPHQPTRDRRGHVHARRLAGLLTGRRPAAWLRV